MKTFLVKIPIAPFMSQSYTTTEGNLELIVVTDRRSLPKGIDKLVVLHGPHANKSQPMTYNKDGTFFCPHCEKSVPFSKELFAKLLSAISSGDQIPLEDNGTIVQIARLHRIMPFFSLDPLVAIEEMID